RLGLPSSPTRRSSDLSRGLRGTLRAALRTRRLLVASTLLRLGRSPLLGEKLTGVLGQCDQLLDLVVPEVLDRVLDVSAVEHQPRVREVLATLKSDDDLTLGVGGDVDVGRGVGHGLFLVPVVGGRCLLSLVLDGGE